MRKILTGLLDEMINILRPLSPLSSPLLLPSSSPSVWSGSALSPEHGSKRHLVKSDPTPFGFKGIYHCPITGATLTVWTINCPPIPSPLMCSPPAPVCFPVVSREDVMSYQTLNVVLTGDLQVLGGLNIIKVYFFHHDGFPLPIPTNESSPEVFPWLSETCRCSVIFSPPCARHYFHSSLSPPSRNLGTCRLAGS